MKNYLLLSILLLFFCQLQAQTISTGSLPASLCAGSADSVPFTITGTFNSGNVFTVQLSDSTGSFSNPVNTQTLTPSLLFHSNLKP